METLRADWSCVHRLAEQYLYGVGAGAGGLWLAEIFGDRGRLSARALTARFRHALGRAYRWSINDTLEWARICGLRIEGIGPEGWIAHPPTGEEVILRGPV